MDNKHLTLKEFMDKVITAFDRDYWLEVYTVEKVVLEKSLAKYYVRELLYRTNSYYVEDYRMIKRIDFWVHMDGGAVLRYKNKGGREYEYFYGDCGTK